MVFIDNRYILAVDVEATCDDGGTIPRHHMEIIEIGAVLLNENRHILDEYQSFIRPLKPGL